MVIAGSLAVVTGASGGIGAATAKELAARGARVVLVARRGDELARLANEIRSTGASATPYVADVTDAKAMAVAASRISSEIGVPDVIVNNAGGGRWRFIDETSPEEAVSMMEAPYFAAFNVTRAFLPGMIKRGSGHIVNVNSPASRFTWPGACAYSAARWALRGFTEALRSDLRGTGIRVTHFVAGETESPYWEHNPGSRERLPKIAKLIPVLSAQGAARALVRGIEANRREVVVPLMMRLVYIQHALFPWAVNWLMRATGYRRR